ncbi:MAG: DUF4251 domain-containing protein [Mucilaginibacter sp.]|nr:DUF4251 domain-containing protein [Mucilaginibacter sp.]
MKNLKTLLIVLLILPLFATTVIAQKSSKKMARDSAQIKAVLALLASKKYTFVAEYASPSQGGSVYLTKYFYMDVAPDEISSLLPFYGAASSSLESKDIEFNLKDFDYGSTDGNNGNWLVNIKPRDSKDVREILLVVNADGSANLSVVSNNKQRMTFIGNIAENESKN